MSLQNRIGDFDTLSRNFSCARPSPLVCIHDVAPGPWRRLQVTAALYMSKCLSNDRMILEDRDIVQAFESEKETIKNITPNGMIVPKRHTILEYNAMVRAFADIVFSLHIGEFAESWHIPNLRIKFAEANPEHLKRKQSSETIHSDSWAGGSSEMVNIVVPLFGDVERNYVALYDPPLEFEESWLDALPCYADGAEIASKYTLLDDHAQKGQISIVDCAILHASTRLPHAGTRVSIDASFHFKRTHDQGDREFIHPLRVNEYLPSYVYAGLGETHLFVFSHTVDQIVDNQGGYKHPANLQVLELLK